MKTLQMNKSSALDYSWEVDSVELVNNKKNKKKQL